MADDEKKAPRFDLRDAAALVGIGLVAYGAWLVYQPAAFIVAGALLIAGALASARA